MSAARLGIWQLGLAAICILLSAPVSSAQQRDRCLDRKTQSEMNSCEAERYARADALMNHTYRELLSQFKAQTDFIAKLTAAQATWLKFRRADIDSFFYAKDKIGTYGSVYPMCRSLLLIHLTGARTSELKTMLNHDESDVCGFAAAASGAARRSKGTSCFALAVARRQNIPADR